MFQPVLRTGLLTRERLVVAPELVKLEKLFLLITFSQIPHTHFFFLKKVPYINDCSASVLPLGIILHLISETMRRKRSEIGGSVFQMV